MLDGLYGYEDTSTTYNTSGDERRQRLNNKLRHVRVKKEKLQSMIDSHLRKLQLQSGRAAGLGERAASVGAKVAMLEIRLNNETDLFKKIGLVFQLFFAKGDHLIKKIGSDSASSSVVHTRAALMRRGENMVDLRNKELVLSRQLRRTP